MNNTIRPRARCQHLLKKDNAVSPEFLLDPVRFVKRYGVRSIGILNQLISLNRKYGEYNSFINQRTLASMFGISRERANKILRIWEEAGLVMRDYIHMKINYYRVSRVLFEEPIRKALVSLLPALRCVALYLLFSNQAATGAIHNLFTQNIKPVIRNLNNYYSYSHTIAKEELLMKFVREHEGSSPVSSVTREIAPEIGLTKLGQIKLSCFPDDAIRYAYKELRATKKKVFDEFRYIYKLARMYCEEQGIVPDWPYVTATLLLYKIDGSGPEIRKELIKREDPLPDAFGDKAGIVRSLPERSVAPRKEHPMERRAFLQVEIDNWKKNIAWATTTTQMLMKDEFMSIAHSRLDSCEEELELLEIQMGIRKNEDLL